MIYRRVEHRETTELQSRSEENLTCACILDILQSGLVEALQHINRSPELCHSACVMGPLSEFVHIPVWLLAKIRRSLHSRGNIVWAHGLALHIFCVGSSLCIPMSAVAPRISTCDDESQSQDSLTATDRDTLIGESTMAPCWLDPTVPRSAP
jgi:hypothetical protein